MLLKSLLIISIALQLVAALVAIRLMRVTKYNVSWILFTAALIAMCVLRLSDYNHVVVGKDFVNLSATFFVWVGVITSFCFAVGVFYVRKIFNYIDRLNRQRQLTERRILTTVLRTEEKERMRFSNDLHDGLGPLLSSAKISLSALSKDNLNDTQKEIVDNTASVIEEAVRSLREISNNLSPHILKDYGLSRAIGSYVNKLNALHPAIKSRFSTNLKDERFDIDVEVILYRVICELISNSIKHSGGSEINLSLLFDGRNVVLNYSDNGRGFNPNAVMDTGMGLSNISSRVNSLKGSVEILSQEGKGMRAVVSVDVSQRKSGEKIK